MGTGLDKHTRSILDVLIIDSAFGMNLTVLTFNITLADIFL